MTSSNIEAVDRIDTELAEIDALVACLRLLWETAEADALDELRAIGVTVSFVVADKIAAARRRVPAAYVWRVRAGRAEKAA